MLEVWCLWPSRRNVPWVPSEEPRWQPALPGRCWQGGLQDAVQVGCRLQLLCPPERRAEVHPQVWGWTEEESGPKLKLCLWFKELWRRGQDWTRYGIGPKNWWHIVFSGACLCCCHRSTPSHRGFYRGFHLYKVSQNDQGESTIKTDFKIAILWRRRRSRKKEQQLLRAAITKGKSMDKRKSNLMKTSPVKVIFLIDISKEKAR